MRISTWIYSFKQGLINIKRNKMFSLASIGTIAACIFLLSVFYAVLANFQHMVKEAEKSVTITVFFENGLDQANIDEIGNRISQRYGVSKIEFTSAAEAWESFRKDYFAEAPELAEGFKEDNPLANSSSYTVYLSDITMQSALVTFLENLDGIRKVKYSETTANTLSDAAKFTGFISAAIIIILLGVGLFLISNTVMIGIAVRKEEIAIMKLIGATDGFVRFPFVIEGIIIGLVGAALPIGAMYFIYERVVRWVMGQFNSIGDRFEFLSSATIFHVLVPVALLIGAGIGFIGSRLTLRKHLKV